MNALILAAALFSNCSQQADAALIVHTYAVADRPKSDAIDAIDQPGRYWGDLKEFVDPIYRAAPREYNMDSREYWRRAYRDCK
jgi:hypothetical protein